MATPLEPPAEVIARDVEKALAEDLGSGDLTAGLIPADTELTTRVICRQAAILAGRPWFEETYCQFSEPVAIDWLATDGDALEAGQELCRLSGNARAILSGERTALNFIQTLSGTATTTQGYVAAVEGTRARILDTRKTLPGLRLAQKYAVVCGGGHNHRTGLYDAVLIKENHISASGSLSAAVSAAKANRLDVLIEVEVENGRELAEAVAAGAQRALLDNFEISDLDAACRAFGGQIELEASGNVSLENIREIASTGVDYISIGAITKHVHAIDFSMRFV